MVREDTAGDMGRTLQGIWDMVGGGGGGAVTEGDVGHATQSSGLLNL